MKNHHFAKMIVIAICLLLCFINFSLCQGAPDVKYVLNFDSPIYVMDEESLTCVDTSDIFVNRYNESTAFMHGKIIVLKKLDSLIETSVGKFDILFSHDICDLCQELGDPESDYDNYLKFFGFPTECPFDEGSYDIKDFCLDIDDFELGDSHVGKYEAELNMFQKTGESCNERAENCCSLRKSI